MANVDYFASADPFASHKPRIGEQYSVEWWLDNFDPDAGRRGLVPDVYDNWAKARDIIAERQHLANSALLMSAQLASKQRRNAFRIQTPSRPKSVSGSHAVSF